jgi:peptide/nickel transport system substrate-binding protein/oligopeptide transport system substrate-binding protein
MIAGCRVAPGPGRGSLPRAGRPPVRGRWPLILAGAFLLCAGVGLQVACGGGGSKALATEQVFRFRIREDPPTLDPARAIDQLSEAVLFNLFRGLVEMDPATLTVRPSVAASWTISDDRLTYTFRLRDDVFFHSGRPVTARDVAWSYRRLLSPLTKSPRRSILEPLAGAAAFVAGSTADLPGLQTPDDRTVVIRLERPFAPFLSALTLVATAILPEEVYGDAGEGYLRNPVGCGPFRFVRWEQSNVVELAAFDRFFGGRPAIDRVLVRIIENHQSALQEYLAGGLDSLDEVPADDKGLMATLKGEVLTYPFIGTQFLGFNLARPPFKGNATLRKALNHAVDKQYLSQSMQGGPVATGILPPGTPGYDPTLPGYPYDPETAKRLLAEAGYPGGRGLPPITLWYNTSEDMQQTMQKIQADLKQVGVDIKLKSVDWAAYITAIEGTRETPGEAQIYRFGWYLDYPDAESILRPLLHSASAGPAGNYSRYANPRVDALIDEAMGLVDDAQRAARYREAERIAVMEDAVWIFLNYYESATLFKPYVKGVVTTPLGEFRIPIERMRIEKGPA